MKNHYRNIAVDLILTILTCGLYNIYVQYVQIKALNDFYGFDRYSFPMWLLLTIITCGLYHLYHEFRMTVDLVEKTGKTDGSIEGILSIFLSAFGLSLIVDAIQQSYINKISGHNGL